MTDVPHAPTSPARGDWARRPLSMIAWWGLPLAVGASASLLQVPFRAGAAIWAGAFAWMATGCLLNAMRCHRVHCYISGPIFLIGAAIAGADGAGMISLSPTTFTNAVSAIMVLAVLSFVPEMVWKRYA
jgi:hypothetical protein